MANDSALPEHWNQGGELGGNDRASTRSWSDCIQLASRKGLRLTRSRNRYKVQYPKGSIVEFWSLDEVYGAMEQYQPSEAQR